MKFPVLALALLLAQPAFAHAMLLQSTPAGGTVVAAPAAISITFTEEVTAGTAVTLTNNGTPIAIGPVALAPNYSVITITPTAPLAPGAYVVTWANTARDDGHKMQGSFGFTVN